MYLMGYAIECSLKASLMQMYRVRTLATLQARLSHRLRTEVDLQTHSLKRLMEWTDAEHRMDGDTRKNWGTVRKWTVHWRYNPNEASEAECRDFCGAAFAVLRFIRNSI